MSFTKSQQLAYDAMMSGENVFLTGEAGTGKSYVIKEFLKKKNKDVLVCAPTGIAAINVGGITLHRAFHLPPGILRPNVRIKPGSVIITAKTIIIDEISMCRVDVFSVIAYILRRTRTHKQLIVVGDFFQLPPVLKDKEKDYLYNYWESNVSEEFEIDDLNEPYAFLSKNWEKFHFRSICLTEQMRQRDDLDFLKNLNRIRVGDESAIPWIVQHASSTPRQGAVYLSSLNADVSMKNKRGLDQINAVPKQYRADIKGNFDKNDSLAEEVLTLKTGCRVMALVNDTTDKKYVNGSLGTVKSMGSDYVIVDFDNGNKNVTVGRYTWFAYDYKSEEKEIKEYRIIKGGADKTGKIKPTTWRVIADGEAAPTQTVTDDGRTLVRTVTKKSIIKTQCGSITQIPLKLAYAVTIHKSQGQTYDAVVLNPYCFDSGQLYVALSRVRRITDLYLERPIEYTDLQTSYVVKDFYSRIQAESNRSLLLPSYPVTSEEMKKFKAWWSRILKQRKLTGQNKQEEDLENDATVEGYDDNFDSQNLNKIGDKYFLQERYEEAFKYYKDAAEQGDAVAQNKLGYMYENGCGVPENYDTAMKWHQKAKKQGHVDAFADIGHLISYRKSVENETYSDDYDEELRKCKEAAEQGDSVSQYNLGYKYHYGKGVQQDYAEAVKWYRKAAAQGYTDATTNLGYMYYFGKGVTQDYIEAAKLYRKAAEQGISVAQYNLGVMHEYGKGVLQNYAEAVKWYRKAAAQGYSLAINALGNMYEYGKGVPQDYVEAARLYQKAAEQGELIAQCNLGYMYEFGKGVPVYYPEAVRWYKKAAEQGYSSAQRSLGCMYRDGKGVLQDYAEALRWYQKAAEQGNDYALADIGYLYEFGKGVERNSNVAKSYYMKAIKLGNSYAKERLKVLTGDK